MMTILLMCSQVKTSNLHVHVFIHVHVHVCVHTPIQQQYVKYIMTLYTCTCPGEKDRANMQLARALVGTTRIYVRY